MIKNLLLQRNSENGKKVYGVSFDYNELVERLKKIKNVDDANESLRLGMSKTSFYKKVKNLSRVKSNSRKNLSTLRVKEFMAELEDEKKSGDNTGRLQTARLKSANLIRSKSSIGIEKRAGQSKSPPKQPPLANLPQKISWGDIYQKVKNTKSYVKPKLI
ncbi:unnamed protein product [Blepharisma stoltei]|uniref:Uncharacterized protein n=1 Tax=Blepharisma stoltei TaxID=1481888 RepID=A0AAU9JN78_9CILI|nr:unnamed protein product [Blepharisma stoltei]